MNVQRMYKPISEDDLHGEIKAHRVAGATLREIAAGYGSPVTHGDIHRVLRGIFPKGATKRAALRLPAVCPACTQKLPRLRPPLPAWVQEAVQHLAELERQAGSIPACRVYARGGKRVESPPRETFCAASRPPDRADALSPPAG